MLKTAAPRRSRALWLFKTEPSKFSWDDLVRSGGTTWDGVANNQAQLYLRQVATGDTVLIYHTGSIKAVVGVARVARGAYTNSEAGDSGRVVVDLVPGRPLARPVELARIRAIPALSTFPLVRISRLSIMPVTPADSTHLLALADEARW